MASVIDSMKVDTICSQEMYINSSWFTWGTEINRRLMMLAYHEVVEKSIVDQLGN